MCASWGVSVCMRFCVPVCVIMECCLFLLWGEPFEVLLISFRVIFLLHQLEGFVKVRSVKDLALWNNNIIFRIHVIGSLN